MRALGLLLLLLCPVYGEALSGPAWAALRRAPEVQLYALDPERLQARTSTRLAGADKRALMQALENAVAESDGTKLPPASRPATRAWRACRCSRHAPSILEKSSPSGFSGA